MKTLNENLTRVGILPISSKLAAKLTEESSEWRKNIKVGDPAVILCVQSSSDYGKIYANWFFDNPETYYHKKIIISDVGPCGPCNHCGTYIGFTVVSTGQIIKKKCFGFSVGVSFHLIHPREVLTAGKILLFNTNGEKK